MVVTGIRLCVVQLLVLLYLFDSFLCSRVLLVVSTMPRCHTTFAGWKWAFVTTMDFARPLLILPHRFTISPPRFVIRQFTVLPLLGSNIAEIPLFWVPYQTRDANVTLYRNTTVQLVRAHCEQWVQSLKPHENRDFNRFDISTIS
jgi:hypothetical protein